MASYNAYIGTLATEKGAFSVELQAIKFFQKYSRAITEMGSDFAQEVKERGNWRTVRWADNKIDDLARPVLNHNVAHQNSKASREAVIKTINSKWRWEKTEYICQYNYSKKYAIIVRKACLRWFWEQAHKLVIESVLKRLKKATRYVTLSCLRIN